MLVIRLARTGKKKQAYFRVVVQEKQKAPGAKFVEILGNYDPHSKKLEVNKDKVAEYMEKGAQPSNSLAVLFKKEGIKLPAWVKINEKNRAPKKKDDEEKKDVKGEAPEAKAAEESGKSDSEPKTEASEEKSEDAPSEDKPAEGVKPEEKSGDKPEEAKEEPKAEEKADEAKKDESNKEAEASKEDKK